MPLPGPIKRLRTALEPAPYDPLTSADWDDRFTKAILISAIVKPLTAENRSHIYSLTATYSGWNGSSHQKKS